eukprot:353368-Chlamydomonas_euryale.AAC.1
MADHQESVDYWVRRQGSETGKGGMKSGRVCVTRNDTRLSSSANGCRSSPRKRSIDAWLLRIRVHRGGAQVWNRSLGRTHFPPNAYLEPVDGRFDALGFVVVLTLNRHVLQRGNGLKGLGAYKAKVALSASSLSTAVSCDDG